MRTITFCSFKGGTAKTSTALHIGASLALYHKKKVLLIDFDSQANLSTGLGFGLDHLSTMVPILQGQGEIRDVIQPTKIKNLSLIPANNYLDGIEKTPQLGNDPYAHERLRRALKAVENDFDYCFIDTPPSLGWLTQSAFFASHFTVICATPEAYSVIALRRLRDFHTSIKQYHDIETLGLVLSFWDERGAVNKEFLNEINNTFPGKLFSSKIRRDIAVSRAVLEGQPVFETDPNSRAAADYKLLVKEFLQKTEAVPPKEKLKNLIKNKREVEV
jgi:chromosome partitioning protein